MRHCGSAPALGPRERQADRQHGDREIDKEKERDGAQGEKKKEEERRKKKKEKIRREKENVVEKKEEKEEEETVKSDY